MISLRSIGDKRPHLKRLDEVGLAIKEGELEALRLLGTFLLASLKERRELAHHRHLIRFYKCMTNPRWCMWLDIDEPPCASDERAW